MSNVSGILRWAAVGVLAIIIPAAVPTGGQAATITVDPTLYCSAGANPATNSDTSTQYLTTSDVSLTIGATAYSPSNCYGKYQTGANDTTTETSALNDIFKGSGTSFLYLDSSSDTASTTGLGGGLKFTVSELGTGTPGPGTWTVSWTDTSTTLPNLPVIVDFAVELNGGNYDAAYLLSSVLLPVSPATGSGSFQINFTNNGGQEPGLSHLVLAGRYVGTPPTVGPEPATLALLGAGLVGLGLIRRRRKAA